MKLSVLTNLYGAKSLEETLQILTSMDIHTVELGAGGYPGKAHCNPEELLAFVCDERCKNRAGHTQGTPQKV